MTERLHLRDDPEYHWEFSPEPAPAQWQTDQPCSSAEEFSAILDKAKAAGYAISSQGLDANKNYHNPLFPSANGYTRIIISADDPVNFKAFEERRDRKDVAVEYLSQALEYISGTRLIFQLSHLTTVPPEERVDLLRSALKAFGVEGQRIKTNGSHLQADCMPPKGYDADKDTRPDLYKGIPILDFLEQPGRAESRRV